MYKILNNGSFDEYRFRLLLISKYYVVFHKMHLEFYSIFLDNWHSLMIEGHWYLSFCDYQLAFSIQQTLTF